MNTYGTGFSPKGLNQEFPLILSAGSTKIIRPTVRVVTGLIVSVESGLLDLFRGENATGVPWRCVPEIHYQWHFPPSDQYVWTALAVNDLTASVVLLGP